MHDPCTAGASAIQKPPHSAKIPQTFVNFPQLARQHSQIGRNQSSGCIRLANWDAFVLCQMAVKGTELEVR